MQLVRPSERTESAVESVMHALMSVSRLMRQRAAGDSLDPGTYWLLKTIGHHGAIRVTDLAASTNLDASTVSRHAAQLERAGSVAREPDPDDGRAQLLTLTDAGRDQVERALARRRELLAASLADWPEQDITDFQRLLATFIDSVDRTTEEPHH